MVQAHAYELLNQKESAMGAAEHPLYAATDRLLAALDRLEGNLQQVTTTQHDTQQDAEQEAQVLAVEQENEVLKAEHAKLNGVINELKGQYGDLHQVATTIYSKLEDSIKRLTQIIEQ